MKPVVEKRVEHNVCLYIAADPIHWDVTDALMIYESHGNAILCQKPSELMLQLDNLCPPPPSILLPLLIQM